MPSATRKHQERDFHNQREELRRSDPQTHDAVYSNRRFYRTTGKSRQHIDNWLRANCPGSQVLDYCCGTGENAIKMAQFGAHVTGVDISNVSIETAIASAGTAGVASNVTFSTMDAENLIYEDSSFDVILCSGVLHHLDLDKAYHELARVLKPDGKILCIEALSDNPLIHWYRRRTPHLRTAWEVDHILSTSDIHQARSFFSHVEIQYFHIASIAAIPFIDSQIFQPVLSFLNATDALLTKIPLLQRMAWQAVFTLSGPRGK